MTLMERNKHILAVQLMADEHRGRPDGIHVVIDTDLNPLTKDHTEQMEIAKIVDDLRAHFAGKPLPTALTLQQVR